MPRPRSGGKRGEIMVKYHISMKKHPTLTGAKREAIRRDGRKGVIVTHYRRFGFTSWIIDVIKPRKRRRKK